MLAGGFAFTCSTQAHDAGQIEEVVITGPYTRYIRYIRYIRNRDFNAASPVGTITQDTILNYNSANIGQYIRDLTYTQNVDTVANVLGGAGGGQDSNSAQFDLRGQGGGQHADTFGWPSKYKFCRYFRNPA